MNLAKCGVSGFFVLSGDFGSLGSGLGGTIGEEGMMVGLLGRIGSDFLQEPISTSPIQQEEIMSLVSIMCGIYSATYETSHVPLFRT